MQKAEIKNILTHALNPKRGRVMLKKLRKRFWDETGLISNEENLAWLQAHCSSFETLARGIDPSLWEESERFRERLANHANEKLRGIEYALGGGGSAYFLYFLTRYTKPNCIVETGVAAGYTSYAFLAAIEENGRGKLHSSDLPYYRLPDPERYIGVLVEDSMKEHWELYIDGDEANLPRICDQVDEIDIFHYDSDKSYSGRRFAMSCVAPKMKRDGVIVMDDLHDNPFFHDYVTAYETAAWRVVDYKGKYVGIVGEVVR